MTDPKHPSLGPPLTSGTNGIYSVAFSRAGHTLASGDADGTIRLWNTADPAHPRLLSQPHTANVGSVFSLAFSLDGQLLASGDANGTIGLWNVTDPAAPHSLGQPLAAHTDKVYSVAFAKNGNTLASASNDETIRLWNLNVDYALKRVCATARNDLTPQQWQAYISQRPFQPPARTNVTLCDLGSSARGYSGSCRQADLVVRCRP
jgi:WD40 repeat protein